MADDAPDRVPAEPDTAEPPGQHLRSDPGFVAVPREARAFQGQRAGIVSRFIANTIDFIVLLAVLLGIYLAWQGVMFLLNPTSFRFTTPTLGAVFVVGGIVLVLYLAVSWATTGRTYGDHVMGLRVVNWRGDRLRPIGALIRAVFCAFVPIGLFWVVVSRANRSWQDVVLRTSVIYDWQVSSAPRSPR